MPEDTNSKDSGSGWTDWASWLVQAYKAYNQSKDPKFKEIPEDPMLTALRGKVLGYIDNSPTRNAFGSMLGSQVQNMGQGFTNPQGKNGYTPYSSGPVKYDLSKILPNISGTGAQATTPVDPNRPAPGSAGDQTWKMFNYNGEGPPPWTLNDGGSASPDPNDGKHRVPNVYGNTNDLLGMNGYHAWQGPGIDMDAIKNAWDNIPDRVKAGGIATVAAFIAASLGAPIGVITPALKGAKWVYDWYQQRNQQPQTPPQGNQNTYNPSNPTQPVLP